MEERADGAEVAPDSEAEGKPEVGSQGNSSSFTAGHPFVFLFNFLFSSHTHTHITSSHYILTLSVSAHICWIRLFLQKNVLMKSDV